jgi:hypothetical protein
MNTAQIIKFYTKSTESGLEKVYIGFKTENLPRDSLFVWVETLTLTFL